jgi:arylsulfatase A-like enzyme
LRKIRSSSLKFQRAIPVASPSIEGRLRRFLGKQYEEFLELMGYLRINRGAADWRVGITAPFFVVLAARFVLLVLAIAVSGSCGYAQVEKSPNILLILVDDMGYGDLGCYNPKSKILTPNIDRLAREGLRFTDAHAPGPLCHPSRYGLMTGRYPFRTDVSVWPTQPLIEKGQMTLASLLRDQGYHTAMVGKWHLGLRENGYDQPLPGGPVDCGFDSFFGIRASTDIPPYFYIRDDRAVTPPTNHISENHSEGWSPVQGAFWREGGIAPDLELKDVLPKFTGEARAIIQAQAGKKDTRKPWMLYLAYPAPHTPWLPSEEFAGKSGAGMYGDFVMMVDAQIGRVLAALDETATTQETLVIFASDNGPVWYPEDVVKFGHDSAGGLRGMKGDVWEGGHRMPFIVRWPGRVKPGTVTDQMICFTDLLATFSDIYGKPLPAAAGPDSFSILPVLEDRQPKGQPIRGPIVMQAGNFSTWSIRSGEWKLINQLGSGGFSEPAKIQPDPGGPQGQLYNLRDDPAETKNLYSEYPDIVTRLEAEMKLIEEGGHSR